MCMCMPISRERVGKIKGEKKKRKKEKKKKKKKERKKQKEKKCTVMSHLGNNLLMASTDSILNLHIFGLSLTYTGCPVQVRVQQKVSL